MSGLVQAGKLVMGRLLNAADGKARAAPDQDHSINLVSRLLPLAPIVGAQYPLAHASDTTNTILPSRTIRVLKPYQQARHIQGTHNRQ